MTEERVLDVTPEYIEGHHVIPAGEYLTELVWSEDGYFAVSHHLESGAVYPRWDSMPDNAAFAWFSWQRHTGRSLHWSWMPGEQ